jgi:hypothetical protein
LRCEGLFDDLIGAHEQDANDPKATSQASRCTLEITFQKGGSQR